MTAPLVSVYPVAKKCWICGRRWTGKSFVPHPADAELLSTCAGCLDSEDEAASSRQRPAPLPAPAP